MIAPPCSGCEPPLAVRVPASTSNLGPGFDCLGLALSLALTVRVLGRAEGRAHVWSERTGTAVGWPADESESVLRALASFELPPLVLAAASEIPLGRGLGSSGAAVAAGLLLGNALAREGRSWRELLTLGVALEGHPDNVTASLFGGCTLCHPAPAGPGSAPRFFHVPLSPALRYAVAWPREPLATARARAALPESVPFADAVENPRRLALLVEGLRTGDPELLALGGEERLHERWRLPLIPGAKMALAAARDAGAYVATISGAGSGLFAIGPAADIAAVAEALRAELERASGEGTARVVAPVLGSPVVEGAREA